ncbi:MAG: glucosyltransferase domain-containing protein [Succinivibrio sp.]
MKSLVYERLLSFIDKELMRLSFIVTFSVGFITYGFGYFNLAVSHDSLFIRTEDVGLSQLTIGRPFTSFVFALLGNYNNKMVLGGASLIFIALSVYLTVKLFSAILHINSASEKYLSVAVSLIYTLNVSFIGLNATYSYQIPCDTLALLLSIATAYVIKNGIHKTNILVAVFLCTVSLGLYQTYVNVTLSLMSVILAIRLLSNNESISSIIIRGGCYLLIVIFASVLYLSSWKILMHIHNVQPSHGGYNSMDGIGFLSLSDLFFYILNSLYNIKSVLFKVNLFNRPVVMWFNLFCLAVNVISAVICIRKIKGVARKILFVALCILFIFCLNITNVASKQTFHSLMAFAICLFNVVAAVFLIKAGKKALKGIFIVWLAIVSFHSCIFYNTLILMKTYELESSYENFSRIIGRIEMIDGFDRDKDTILIEPLERNPFFNSPEASIFSKYKFFVGCSASVATTYNPAQMALLYNLNLKAIGLYDVGVIKTLNLTRSEIDTINKMKAYPARDSVKRVGKYIIVRNSDQQY